ncbi:unnamed protein product, partial [marine sediment metagenome]
MGGTQKGSSRNSHKILKGILATMILTLFVIWISFPFVWMLSTSLKTNPE